MPLQFLLPLAGIFLLLLASNVRAGASLTVDDATVTPRGRCQVEAWARAYAPGQKLSAAPACNWGGSEFGLGISQYARPSHGPIVNLGLKHLFRDFDEHDWGIGASVGVLWNGRHDHHDGWNVNLPASFALDAQRVAVMHANLGWSKSRDALGALTGGLGIERVFNDSWTLLAEVYGDHRGGFGSQIGVRHALGSDASLDVLWGHQDDMRQTPWLTLGVNVLFPN